MPQPTTPRGRPQRCIPPVTTAHSRTADRSRSISREQATLDDAVVTSVALRQLKSLADSSLAPGILDAPPVDVEPALAHVELSESEPPRACECVRSSETPVVVRHGGLCTANLMSDASAVRWHSTTMRPQQSVRHDASDRAWCPRSPR